MSKIQRLPNPIALNIAGGLSKALGTVSVACPQMPGGSFECLVMPETPSVISVGERCLDHGYSFHWPAGKTPYLLLPNGRRVNLVVDGKIPYLTLEGRQAMGQVDVAVARGAPALPRWACAFSCAEKFLESPGTLGGPPDGTIQIRTTLDMHTHEVLAEHNFSGERWLTMQVLTSLSLICLRLKTAHETRLPTSTIRPRRQLRRDTLRGPLACCLPLRPNYHMLQIHAQRSTLRVGPGLRFRLLFRLPSVGPAVQTQPLTPSTTQLPMPGRTDQALHRSEIS